MGTADEVLERLERAQGVFVSGTAIAEALGVSRNAVWKAVQTLERRGIDVESVTGRGYRLDPASSRLSASSVRRWLDNPQVRVEYYDEIGSTNDRAKELAASGATGAILAVADCQTAGKGRQGRAFFSPPGCGVYFSLSLRPSFPLEEIAYITSYAAVCVAQAIEEVFGQSVQIKWVNDVFAAGRKVCGILTEAAVQPESGQVDYVVVGIGINVSEPAEGFPREVANVAGSLCTTGNADDDDRRARLVASTVRSFLADFERLGELPHLDAYRAHSMLDGRRVRIEAANESFEADVVGIDDSLRLVVRLADGSERRLVHGEVHIPSSQL